MSAHSTINWSSKWFLTNKKNHEFIWQEQRRHSCSLSRHHSSHMQTTLEIIIDMRSVRHLRMVQNVCRQCTMRLQTISNVFVSRDSHARRRHQRKRPLFSLKTMRTVRCSYFSVSIVAFILWWDNKLFEEKKLLEHFGSNREEQTSMHIEFFELNTDSIMLNPILHFIDEYIFMHANQIEISQNNRPN